MSGKIRVGISSCLLGEKVRYDGGDKRDHFLADTLGRYVEYVPVCPEFEAGFGVPREAMRLTGDPSAPGLVIRKTGEDLTGRMNRWIRGRLLDLEKGDVRGFIFKSGSPSCGRNGVKLWDNKGKAGKSVPGLFAGAFMERFPQAPVEDENGLHDIDARENFIVRLFAFGRWKEQCARDRRPAAIIEFHARHKYLLMAHSPAILKEMGKLVARVTEMERRAFIERYETLFMEALRTRATVRKNVNVLEHVAGYFRDHQSADEKKELAEAIGQYRRELVPLIVPVALMRHHVRKYGEEYLAGQYYLDPHPLELKLRNHA